MDLFSSVLDSPSLHNKVNFTHLHHHNAEDEHLIFLGHTHEEDDDPAGAVRPGALPRLPYLPHTDCLPHGAVWVYKINVLKKWVEVRRDRQ